MSASSFSLPRRDFLRGALAASLLATRTLPAAPAKTPQTALIDTNAWLGQWPIRRLALDAPAAPAAKLKKNNGSRAWFSSLDGLLQKDIAAVNSRLAEDCRRFPMFEPFGVINLSL